MQCTSKYSQPDTRTAYGIVSVHECVDFITNLNYVYEIKGNLRAYVFFNLTHYPLKPIAVVAVNLCLLCLLVLIYTLLILIQTTSQHINIIMKINWKLLFVFLFITNTKNHTNLIEPRILTQFANELEWHHLLHI